jgi:Restriction alleviation protein Lar
MSVMMTESMLQPPRAQVGPLRPCPFCGEAPRLEADPWMDESIRIACGNDTCGVMPRTEYLLACYADELVAAWNARPASTREGADA